MYDEMRHDGAPEVVQLWDRTHTARKPGKVCEVCKDPIQPGERYTTSGMKVDGAFEVWVRHQYGEMHPSGCPKLRAIDDAEERSYAY